MFESLRGFLGGLASANGAREFDENDHRLAATALLIHVADADGDIDREENQRLLEIISARFGLDTAEAARLIREAIKSDHEAVGIDHFVNVLRRALDDNGRLKLVEMMWDIVFADGEASEIEDTIVWRIAGLLGISEKDRDVLRRSRAPGSWPETPV